MNPCMWKGSEGRVKLPPLYSSRVVAVWRRRWRWRCQIDDHHGIESWPGPAANCLTLLRITVPLMSQEAEVVDLSGVRRRKG